MVVKNILSKLAVVGVAALGTMAISRAASAATIDAYYRFDADYYLNCPATCDTQRTQQGAFELRLNYQNVDVGKGRFDNADLFTIRSGGETTARFATPIGDISFRGIGRGDQDLILFDPSPFFEIYESVSAIFDGFLNNFSLGGVLNFFEGGVIEGRSSTAFLVFRGPEDQREGDDISATFRLQNASGDYITSDFQTNIHEIRYIVSGLPMPETSPNPMPAPSPVPLPATAPLLLAALGLLGWRSRKALRRAAVR